MSNTAAKIRELVEQQTRPEKVVPLCLRADIQSQIEALELQLIEVRKEVETLAGNPEAVTITEQIEALIEEAREATVDVTLRALPRKQWSDLVTKYPPKSDEYLYDVAMLNEAIPACWVSPEIDDETRDKLLDGLTQGQYDRLAETAQQLNRGDVNVPFSALATRVRLSSGASEK